jgi:hypothetical protein
VSVRTRLSNFFRNRRALAIRDLISELGKTRNRIEILDIGGRVQYWDQIGRPFLRRHNVTVTLLNLHVSEFFRSEPDGVFNFVIGDACQLDFRDRQFDLAHSNSVIEHVGSWQNMKAFAAEIRRIANCYYVQTPYFWFPVDPHFYAFPMFHWLPRPTRARLLNSLPLATAGKIKGVDKSFEAVDGSRLLDSRQFRFLFPDARISFERFFGLPKSMIAIRYDGN